ncbi:MAG TPA: 16S rRNA (guanine(527)-N(7))-methyltransferase RsmG [bacterium]|nr:16S rRNA (guanine(527)-N(7))-methyltransferase RsmG [bacterium]
MAIDVSRETFRAALDSGLTELGLSLSEEVLQKSADLYALLLEWNRVHNLTRISDPVEAAHRHFVESWASLLLPGLFDGVSSVADIGSGAGFPGLPLALARPDTSFTLVEKAPKKAAYLSFAAASLKMENISIRCADARRLSDRFDLVTFRALTSDDRFVGEMTPLLSPGGRLLLFLGPSQKIPSGLTGHERTIILSGKKTRFALLSIASTRSR